MVEGVAYCRMLFDEYRRTGGLHLRGCQSGLRGPDRPAGIDRAAGDGARSGNPGGEPGAVRDLWSRDPDRRPRAVRVVRGGPRAMVRRPCLPPEYRALRGRLREHHRAEAQGAGAARLPRHECAARSTSCSIRSSSARRSGPLTGRSRASGRSSQIAPPSRSWAGCRTRFRARRCPTGCRTWVARRSSRSSARSWRRARRGRRNGVEFLVPGARRHPEEGLIDIQVARFEDGFFATWRDVTDRVLAAEALHHSEHRFRQFFERTPDYVFIRLARPPPRGRQPGRARSPRIRARGAGWAAGRDHLRARGPRADGGLLRAVDRDRPDHQPGADARHADGRAAHGSPERIHDQGQRRSAAVLPRGPARHHRAPRGTGGSRARGADPRRTRREPASISPEATVAEAAQAICEQPRHGVLRRHGDRAGVPRCPRGPEHGPVCSLPAIAVPPGTSCLRSRAAMVRGRAARRSVGRVRVCGSRRRLDARHDRKRPQGARIRTDRPRRPRRGGPRARNARRSISPARWSRRCRASSRSARP